MRVGDDRWWTVSAWAIALSPLAVVWLLALLAWAGWLG